MASRKRPSCFLEDTGKASHKQIRTCEVLRSKQGNQAYGHLQGIDLARFKVMAESVHACEVRGLKRRRRRNVVSLSAHRTLWTPITISGLDLQRRLGAWFSCQPGPGLQSKGGVGAT